MISAPLLVLLPLILRQNAAQSPRRTSSRRRTCRGVSASGAALPASTYVSTCTLALSSPRMSTSCSEAILIRTRSHLHDTTAPAQIQRRWRPRAPVGRWKGDDTMTNSCTWHTAACSRRVPAHRASTVAECGVGTADTYMTNTRAAERPAAGALHKN